MKGSLHSRVGDDQRAVLSATDDARPSSASSTTLGDTAFSEGVPTDLTHVPCQPSPKSKQGPETESVPN